jgi:FAD/FMN-containing dehydrogenase
VINRRALLRAGASAAVLAAGAGSTGVAALAAVRRPRIDWERLRRSIRGDVVLPGDANYDQARLSDFTQFDHIRPQAAAFCETTQDVQAVLRFARDNDLHTAVRSGGHSFAGYSTTNGLILDVSRLNQIGFGTSTVSLGPGTQQIDALAAAAPRGVSLVGGLCPTVCAGGFLQGGGIGWATRKFGMGADRVVAAEVVLADGRVVQASEHQHPDLFWALRGGGGGNFGVVTGYQVRPVQAPRMVNYNLTWPWEKATAVLAAWQHWIVGNDRSLGGEMALLWPDAGTGTPSVMVYGGYLGAKDALDSLVAALESAVGSPAATKDIQDLTYHDAMLQWYGCASFSVDECHRVGYLPDAKIPRQNYFWDRNRFTSREIPSGGLDQLVSAFTVNPRPGQFRVLALFAAGGAANDVHRTATAYVHRTSQLFVHYAAALNTPTASEEDKAAATAWIANGFATADRYSNGESYLNFTDPQLRDWKTAYYAENYPRLAAVKRGYDPEHFFTFAQGIR